MSYTKVDFTKESSVQSDEMFSFLQTYATGYFDSIIHPPDGDGKRHENIECTINLSGGGTSTLNFNYYNNSLYANISWGYSPNYTSWAIGNQSNILYAIAAPKGIFFAQRAYNNLLGFGFAKTEENETFLYLPQYNSNNMYARFANMHTGATGSQGANISTSNPADEAYFSIVTGATGGTALCPMVTGNSGSYSYSPYLLRVPFTQYRGTFGILTLNDKQYFTNGVVALLLEEEA